MKKTNVFLLVLIACTLLLAACGAEQTTQNNQPAQLPNLNETNVDESTVFTGAIAVVSREEGSGARGAFEELVQVNINDDYLMTADAIIQSGNGIVATFVRDNVPAIGYISFATYLANQGNLIGLSIDGIAPTTENMLSGEYTLVRPFNFVYMPNLIGIVEEAFIAFTASLDGLYLLEDMGAVVDRANAMDFNPADWDLPAGTVSFGGSTSTEATAMRLMEEFMAIFPQIEITYESVGSGAGITGAQEGTFSLGFASREIRDSELETGINVVTYCVDGIVVIVNPTNTVRNITSEELRSIYLGNITDWSDVQ